MVWQAFTDLANNLNFELGIILLILVNFGGLIFYAKDFKVGLALSFLANALLYLAYKLMGAAFNPQTPFTLMLIFLVLLAFSIFAAGKSSSEGVLV